MTAGPRRVERKYPRVYGKKLEYAMQHNSRESWADAFLWGMTAAIIVLTLGISGVLLYGGWIPGNH